MELTRGPQWSVIAVMWLLSGAAIGGRDKEGER